MSRIISELLGANEPLFSLSVKQLEDVTGKQGIDVRLTAEIIGLIQLKTRDLGLDVNDTTGKELYHALLSRLKKDDESFCKMIGVTDSQDVDTIMPLIKKVAEKAKINHKCWVLKKSVAKEFLRKLPPPNIMKRLNFKSIDSMLKNENIFEIYGALRFVENPMWLKEFNDTYKTLKPSDFESRDIEIVIMPKNRWGDATAGFIAKKKHNLTHLKELGAIIILPTPQERIPGVTIFDMLLIFHYINEIRLYSTYFKLQQVRPDFGKLVVNTLNADRAEAAVMAGQKIHWRIINRYFGKLKSENHPEVFEPHVQPEDLHWRKAENMLFKIDNSLNWWRDLDYVGVMSEGKPVSLNLMDIATNYCNNLEFKDRVYFHFRESLWNELFERYMGEKTLEQQVLKQLDNDMIAPETIQTNIHSRGF